MADFSELISMLNSRVMSERIEAVKLLGKSGDSRAAEYLINNLPELHSELRMNIVQALGCLKDKKASGPLIIVYDETPSSNLKKEIINSMLKIKDEQSISKLMQIASSLSEEVYFRILILKEIIKFEEKDSSEIINTAVELLQDKNNEIKKRALNIIIHFNVKNIQNYLLPMIKEGDIDIRVKSLRYLYKLEGENLIPKLISILSSESVESKSKERIVEVLWIINSPKITDLLEKLCSCNELYIRRNAVISLAHTQIPKASEIIVKRLQDEEHIVRNAALMALAKLNARHYVKNIMPLLMDKNDEVRKEAVVTIQSLIDDRELEKLEPLMKNPNLQVLKSVLEIFSNKKYFPSNFYKNVSSFMETKDDEIIKSVIKILSILKDKKTYDVLISLYNNASENIKVEILYTLKNFNNLYAEMIPFLFEYYKNEDSPKLRAILTDIISLAKNHTSGNILLYIVKNETDKRTKSNAIEALEQYVDVIEEVELVNTIMPSLKDENNRVKANAAKALWKFGGLRMVSMLEDMMKEEDRWQKASACFVLGEIGAFQVVPILKTALNDSEDVVRANAVKALGKCGELDTLKEIFEVYNQETDVVKQAIVFSARFLVDEKYMDFIIEKFEDKNKDIAIEAAYTYNSLMKIQPVWVDKVSDRLDKYPVEVLNVIIDGLGSVSNKISLDILERLSYHSVVSVASKALSNFKKVEKNCI
ncbi:MAG: HEAT repeat domain-containing protein [Candidatus Muiribacteriota bacterium]